MSGSFWEIASVLPPKSPFRGTFDSVLKYKMTRMKESIALP
jgi:hypothetical protein